MADKSITAANVATSANAVIATGIAGAAIARTTPLIYQDPTDNTWKPAKANGAAPIYKAVAWALNDASAGQPIHYVTYDPSFTPGYAIAVHEINILSGNTAGKPCDLADDASGWYFVQMLVGIGSNKAILNFLQAYVPKP